MKYTKTYTLILLSTTMGLFTSCINCPKNYTSTIRSIMKPMKANLADFYAREQKYPSDTQRDKLLESSGCKSLNSQQKTCRYKGTTFSYDSGEGLLYPNTTPKYTSPQDYNVTTNDDGTKEVTVQEPEREEGINIYTFSIVRKDSLCSVNMTFEGEMLNIECIQHSCIKI
ncbi:MAG: hypothetical protein L3J43_05495 [Sulfurovum sp.]|nr:hypothetical protein [Sulfurovum sp.]